MEEERIKSALELAMERVKALPELTPEEIAAQKEKEFGPVGISLAMKYMSGAIAADELPSDLGRHAPDRRSVIRRALISSLCGEILAEASPETAMKALKGISLIAPERSEFFASVEANISGILSEFEVEKKNRFHAFDDLANEKLRTLGISGSAVRPNMSESEEWNAALDRIKQAYEPRLESIRKNLIQEIG